MAEAAHPRARGRRSAVIALLAGASSIAIWVLYFFYWWELPDLLWELSLELALVAVIAGLVATGRALTGRRSRGWPVVGGLLGALLGGLVLAWVVLILYALATSGYD
jgi:hypothetical protein